jgi:hypothetical protein
MLFARQKGTYRRTSYPFTIVATMLMTLALSLSACGLSSVTTIGPGAGDASTPTTSASGTGASAKPCPVVGTSVNLGTPALVLTPKSANEETTAHVGDQIVVELPTTSRWRLAQAQSAQLQPNDPQGALDDSLNACVWSFKAQSSGDAALDFTGSAVCESGQVCPDFQLNLTFAIKVE